MRHYSLMRLIAGLWLISTLPACGTARVDTTITTTPTSPPTKEPARLATPYAQLPAAGICASFDGNWVVVTINADIPDPRCSKVRADQMLQVINRTENTLQVSIANFEASLEPGAQVEYDTPFGDYLEAGVHQLHVEPCCGPELWLEVSP